MKLAEALLLRSEYQQKIENLQQRIAVNIKVQEEDTPHEDPNDLLTEIFSLNDQLYQLIQKINATNNKTKLPNGQSIAEALVQRDMLIKKRNILANMVGIANERDYRLTHTEIKMHITIPVADLQKQIDQLSREYRELDTLIQGTNWTVDMDAAW